MDFLMFDIVMDWVVVVFIAINTAATLVMLHRFGGWRGGKW